MMGGIMLKQALEYAQQNKERHLAELKEFVAIPSISTLSENKPDIQRAADWVANQMRNMGMKNVAIMPTAGHPVAYGEWLEAGDRPTVLIYGHYDVQPVDPVDEWQSPPFQPTIRGDNMYARGASDMKGNDHAFLKALQAWMKNGGLPVNVKVIVEGEEEIGSPHLGAFMDQHKGKLKCDIALNADSGILSPDTPSIVYGLRGLAYFELWVQGPAHDLHSGIFGGSVHNPAQALAELVAGMHDKKGRITLPGFYDLVRNLSKKERKELARVPHSDKEWQAMTGAPKLHGEKGFSTLERVGVRPTLEVNGMISGFTGEGAKTVLPAKAMAKISMRLVPRQDADAVEKQLKNYMKKHAPKTIKWQVKKLTSGPAVLVDRDTVGVRAAVQALQDTFGKVPVFKYEGGSVPVVSMVQEKLHVDSVLLGFGLPDDNLHAPNEKLHLPNYYRGIETYIRFFDAVAR
jgi:acetylornithine deacetylase/succinyl-diaminopimelate desuccinylase-like protein